MLCFKIRCDYVVIIIYGYKLVHMNILLDHYSSSCNKNNCSLFPNKKLIIFYKNKLIAYTIYILRSYTKPFIKTFTFFCDFGERYNKPFMLFTLRLKY